MIPWVITWIQRYLDFGIFELNKSHYLPFLLVIFAKSVQWKVSEVKALAVIVTGEQEGSLTNGVHPLRKICWIDMVASCGLWNKSLNTWHTLQMEPLVLEVKLILLYYGAGADIHHLAAYRGQRGMEKYGNNHSQVEAEILATAFSGAQV